MRQNLIRTMRAVVDYLGNNTIAQKLFFFVAFFTIRPFFPVQYLLLRELINSSSVLDLGCGRHSMVPIIPTKIHKVGVELFKPHYEEALKKSRHNEYICADLTQVEFPEKSFDSVVLLDVLEHLTKEEGAALIVKMEKWARKKVIIFTPNGFLPQDEYDTNPLMVHKSGWKWVEFIELGYKVYGVRGFKKWRKESGHDGHEESWRERLVDLTQIITYHFPDTAFQLFCVKKMG